MLRMVIVFALVFVAAIVAAGNSHCPGQDSLHHRIDRLLAESVNGPTAPQSTDAAFFRRIHLDLVGRIPASQITKSFLDDQSPGKREKAVDRLLNSPLYPQHMANVFDVMLMERRGDHAEWQNFLVDSFSKNRPWDQIAQEILHPKRDNESTRGSAFFTTKRLEKVGQQTIDFAGLTRDVGRMFLGVDLQCAQCHDHLFIDDYTQKEFQGLFSVYRNVSIRNEKFPAINEKTMSAKLDFNSVFDADKKNTGPRIPFGKEFDIPPSPKADPKARKKRPSPNDPPTFSALELIAQNLPKKENRLFRQNIANRIWFVMMGQGLVEPLDQFHSSNPATHPRLLELLANEFAQHHFDIKWFIRELVLSETCQRSTRFPSDSLPAGNSYQLGAQRHLTAEQWFHSLLQATGNLKRLLPDGKPTAEYTDLKEAVVKAFATEPKEPSISYSPAVKQALFLLNDSKLLKLLEPNAGNLTDRLSKLPVEKATEELYLSIFCRTPTAEEKKFLTSYLEQNKKQNSQVLKRVVWAMVTSMEFSVNH